MTWKLFEKIIEAPGSVDLRLVVDPLVPALAWGMHEACGTEVLFYVRRAFDPDYAEEEGRGVVTFYLVIGDPASDVFVPPQRASEYDVEVVDPAPLEYGYAVVHTHPRGVTRFSSTDKEYINVNHPVSVLVESGRVSDAVISLGAGGVVIQARPRVEVAERRVAVELVLPGGRSLRLEPPGDVLKSYVESLLRGPMRKALENIEGCRAARRRRRKAED